MFYSIKFTFFRINHCISVLFNVNFAYESMFRNVSKTVNETFLFAHVGKKQ